MGGDAQRVLVVDDDATFRDFVVSILRACGFATDAAADGEAAIARLGTAPPDLMLLDLCMPGVDGWGVLEHLSARAERPRVVVVSGAQEIMPPGHLGQCITGYVFKPFRGAQLIRICKEVLARTAVVPASGSRKAARRTFVVDASVIGDGGVAVAHGRLVEVSRGGFRLELGAPLAVGRPIKIAFRVPGHAHPIEVAGQVRWANALAVGVEVSDVSGSDETVLRALVDLDGPS